MQSVELTTGRRIGVVLHPGDDVLSTIADACVFHGVKQGYVSVFLGAFRSVRFIASHEPVADPEPPLKDSTTVEYVEGVGSGSVTWDEVLGAPQVHLHVAVGVKDDAAAGHAGHLLAATTHYVAELVIEEVLAPTMSRVSDVNAHGLENLAFTYRG
ncbi:PPC domain-containing DNA-binding protein [Glaciihabitans sp. dw_435]|uniref:PPC domain-containing DNA-binding protein n=1 Tax=Glaciihabitans sp. dw_435 TaxID=2720081 RepID=UPI001BD622BC|nr:PPC domain-containing DNA-binding protein [Glaciihabitans sp. dw_435]